MDAARPVRLFVSYSHDSSEHAARVLEIAQRLRSDGFECDLDQFVLGSPPEGWPRWMNRKLIEADFVLVVCTEIYSRRFDGARPGEGGLGVNWEGLLLTQELYESGGINSKYVPVVLEREDLKYIPIALRPVSHYLLPNQYADLHRFLKRQPRVVPNPVGEQVLLLPLSSPMFTTPAPALYLADGGLPSIQNPITFISSPYTAVEDLDIRLTDPMLQGRERSDILLRKAILLQKLGQVNSAQGALEQYELAALSARERPDSDYLICKGKLIAQHRDHRSLQEYIGRLDLEDRFRTTDGEHQLSPLLWRLGLLTRLPNSLESERYLKRHGSTVTISDYQYAHNQQCIAFADILDAASNPSGFSCRAKADVELALHNAYLGYMSVESFVYQDKCLASNLAMLGVLYLKMREPRRAYEHLLHARFAFQRLGVRPRHEAMAEITGILKDIVPEAYSLLFGRLATIIPGHAQGDLIRELHGDVSRVWSYIKTDERSGIVERVYSSLAR